MQKKYKKNRIPSLLILCGLAFVLFSCNDGGDGDWEREKIVTTKVQNEGDDFLVKIHTKYGSMQVVLFDDTPIHKENFIKLAKQHYYDSLLFHRVIKGFMIQGGDPDSRFASEGESLGQGGLDYILPAEITETHFHQKGALAMARKGDNVNPDLESNAGQFYIVQGRAYRKKDLLETRTDYSKVNKYFSALIEDPEYANIATAYATLNEREDVQGQKRLMKKCIPLMEKKYKVKLVDRLNKEEMKKYTSVGGAPFLDQKYTVFGQVIDGLDIIDSLSNQKVDKRKRPIQDLKMWVEIEEVPMTSLRK
ncbi:peptidylprolyl isomerase [Flammeovirga kamogawensis]|uniref:peptidylprolyl isomerase n=1 Tax=Flammeovirga kamogawensis TaxID=373891 RepID=A0ABX8GSE7_9BACT|nr:peptidylprolyl isomerase [Flammeovirga kamogawensis]MBB6462980.1 cyclophilin family peptidyl-prolyl cis-trans isomerase [Flammeovirga kamogawensis]QWG06505.1 peptidylprolyl isomerase [Flammeovirga kamogawensis]TRX68333.1 peptidylprolyl isomerase [Flammeovirga kamogawensis]